MNKYFYDRNNRFKLSIIKSKLFWGILVLKIITASLFASSYLTDLFYPFVEFYINNDINSTYTFFYYSGKSNSFPYPVLMLYILSFLKAFFSNDAILSFVDILILRIPILLADISILLILSRWLKLNLRELLIYYWLNPILFYINYMHGQLDVIPTAFLMISMYFLFKKQWLYSSLFIAFSILCKTNFIIALPFLILYYLKSHNLNNRKLFYSIVISFLVIFLFHLPVIDNYHYFNTVYNNATQGQLFNLALVYQNSTQLSLFIAPSALFLVFFYGITFKTFDKNLFILFMCFCFASMTIFTSPGQGWYYWFIPLLVFFTIKQKSFNKLFYWLFIASYFLYFLLIPESDFLSLYLFSEEKSTFYSLIPLNNEVKKNIISFSFTLLQTSLFVNIIFILVNGIEEYKKNKLLYQPLLIGIGGDSGSGKTTFSKIVQNLYGPSQTTIIRGDDMHKWERGDNNWKEKTHLNPSANHIHKEIEFIKFLKKGLTINRRSYDHSSGKFTIPSKIKSKRVIIYEGLHPFYLSDMRNSFDISFFIQPDEKLRRKWKIERDTKKRGYSKEKILKQIKERENDSLKYIRSQAEKADVWINLKASNLSKEGLILNIKINSNLDLEILLLELNNLKDFKYDYHIDQLHHHLVFYEGIGSKTVEEIAYNINSEIDELFSDIPHWEENFNGILQIIQIACIQSKLSNE